MGNVLKTYREEKCLTQQAVADKLDVSRQMVAFLEKDEREFTADMAVKIERELGIPRAKVRPDLFAKAA